MFCGKGPVTAEHVWPQWIAKYVENADEKIPHTAEVRHEGQEPRIEFRGIRVPFTTEAKCVCKPCNEGWMHELETSAEPILAPLIQGKSAVWHEWRQTIAAFWAVKTAMMLEQTQKLRAIPAEIYPLFRKYQTPPPYCQVWTAAYDGDIPHNFGRGAIRMALTTPEGVAVPNEFAAYGAFVQIGALAFRIFGHLFENGPTNVPQGELARALVSIRPVVPAAAWPPEMVVNDEGLELLVMSMADEDVSGPTQP